MKEGTKLAVTINEPLDDVLGNYPIKVISKRNESYKEKKGVWWITVPDRQLILKKISNSEETLKFILHAVRHLQSNGVRLPEVIKTKDGNDYVNMNGICYVLTEAVEGKNPSYSSEREMNLIAAELANFHKASAGFKPPAGCKPKYHLGLWVEDYTAQLEEINGFYKKCLANPENDAIGKAVIKEFPYFCERGQKAIDGLRGQDYAGWVTQAKNAGSLCHQDFAAGNLIMTNSSKMYVIDTDSITVDIPARDIRKLLNKVMKKAGKWDLNLTKKILSAYQTVNPLTPSQWRVVKLDLQFPHLFVGAVNKYIYQRDKEWSKEKYLKRILEMSALEKTADPVLNNFESIIPG